MLGEAADELIEEAMGLAQVTRFREIPAGRTLYRQDTRQPGQDSIFVVTQGRVVLQTRMHNAREIDFYHLEAGELFGGFPLIADLDHTESAIAEISLLRQTTEDGEPVPINWERVHRLPDHVRFVHEAHIRFFTNPETGPTRISINGEKIDQPLTVPQTCAICHGDVAAMEVVKPKRSQSLKMGTCLDCHRQNNAPTDCTVCHK